MAKNRTGIYILIAVMIAAVGGILFYFLYYKKRQRGLSEPSTNDGQTIAEVRSNTGAMFQEWLNTFRNGLRDVEGTDALPTSAFSEPGAFAILTYLNALTPGINDTPEQYKASIADIIKKSERYVAAPHTINAEDWAGYVWWAIGTMAPTKNKTFDFLASNSPDAAQFLQDETGWGLPD